MNFTSLKAIFDASPSPQLILLPDSPRFTIAFVNKAYCLVTNTIESHLLNKGLFEAFPENPNDSLSHGRETVTASLNQVIATKSAHRIESQKYDIPIPGTNDFEVRYWSPENIPVLNDQGEIDYIIHSVTDITEKRILKKAFDVERQRFQSLYFQAPSCMGILKGPNHVYELANPLYLQFIEKKDIIGKTVKEVLPELEAQGIFQLLDNVYNTGLPFSANEMLMQFDFNGNGKLVDTYLNFVYQAHRDSEGKIDGILFFGIDVTEQVVSRKKIEEKEKHYQELIRELPVATYSCDSEGRIVLYNKAAVDLWGSEPESGQELWCGSGKTYTEDGLPIPLNYCAMAVALKEGRLASPEEIII